LTNEQILEFATERLNERLDHYQQGRRIDYMECWLHQKDGEKQWAGPFPFTSIDPAQALHGLRILISALDGVDDIAAVVIFADTWTMRSDRPVAATMTIDDLEEAGCGVRSSSYMVHVETRDGFLATIVQDYDEQKRTLIGPKKHFRSTDPGIQKPMSLGCFKSLPMKPAQKERILDHISQLLAKEP
jgi:hypothetical protein